MDKRNFLKTLLLGIGAAATGQVSASATEAVNVVHSDFILTGALGREALLNIPGYVPEPVVRGVRSVCLIGHYDGLPVYFDPYFKPNEMWLL